MRPEVSLFLSIGTPGSVKGRQVDEGAVVSP
jgi:hypothetical protein